METGNLIDSASRAVVGLDMGGTKCLGIALDGAGNPIAEARITTPRDPHKLLESVTRLVTQLSTSCGGILALGVGLPGAVTLHGELVIAPNLPGLERTNVRDVLQQAVNVPVHVENDATCATWGERELGAAQGHDHVLMVTLGTGIGGGIVANGELYRGAHGFAGEVGHMIVDRRGPPCGCGQSGCWEVFASGRGLVRLARESVTLGGARRILELAGGRADLIAGEHVTRAAEESDADAQYILGKFCDWVVVGLVTLANVFDPDIIVVGGGIPAAGPIIMDPLGAAWESPACRRVGARIQIVPAVLGDRAGAIGAACLARYRQPVTPT